METNKLESETRTDEQSEKNENISDLQPTDTQTEDTKGGASAQRRLRDLLID